MHSPVRYLDRRKTSQKREEQSWMYRMKWTPKLPNGFCSVSAHLKLSAADSVGATVRDSVERFRDRARREKEESQIIKWLYLGFLNSDPRNVFQSLYYGLPKVFITVYCKSNISLI